MYEDSPELMDLFPLLTFELPGAKVPPIKLHFPFFLRLCMPDPPPPTPQLPTRLSVWEKDAADETQKRCSVDCKCFHLRTTKRNAGVKIRFKHLEVSQSLAAPEEIAPRAATLLDPPCMANHFKAMQTGNLAF